MVDTGRKKRSFYYNNVVNGQPSNPKSDLFLFEKEAKFPKCFISISYPKLYL